MKQRKTEDTISKDRDGFLESIKKCAMDYKWGKYSFKTFTSKVHKLTDRYEHVVRASERKSV